MRQKSKKTHEQKQGTIFQRRNRIEEDAENRIDETGKKNQRGEDKNKN